MSHPLNYMLDTNVFSNLVTVELSISDLPTGQFWATPVQLQELKNTKDSDTRARLLSIFKELIIDQGTKIPAPFTWGVEGAGFDEGEWTSGEAYLWQTVKNGLDEAWDRKPRKRKKNSKKENNPKDATIAVAAKLHDFTLMTCDCDLAAVCEKHEIKVLLVESLGT